MPSKLKQDVQPTVASRGEVQRSQVVTDLWHLQYCCLGSFHLKKFGVVSAVMPPYKQREIRWWSRHTATLHHPSTMQNHSGELNVCKIQRVGLGPAFAASYCKVTLET